MSKIVDEVVGANQKYAREFGAKGELALPPARQFAILTCMDARLDPAKYAGLAEGDAHVIRNAGGRATDDVIRSLVISHKLLGTREWFVIHHTNCGMELFSDEVMADLLVDDWRRLPLTEGLRPASSWLRFRRRGHFVSGTRWPRRASFERGQVVRRSFREHPLVRPRWRQFGGGTFRRRPGVGHEVEAATKAGKANAA